MKTFLKSFLILVLTVLAVSFEGFAQKRAERTASAKAYYGYSFSRPKMKKAKKTKTVRAVSHTKPARGTRAEAWEVKRRYTRS